MEYNSSDHQVYCSPKKREPDLLTQSLTSVFGNSAAIIPRDSPRDPRQREVYAVPIQQYPAPGISTTTTPQGTSDKVTSDGIAVQTLVRGQPGGQECSGDLISAAWSLSCDMTKSWQKAEEAVSKDVPSDQMEEAVLNSVNNVADTSPIQNSIPINHASNANGVRVTSTPKVQLIETTPNIQIPETLITAVTDAPRSNCGEELATVHENGDQAVPGCDVCEVNECEKVTTHNEEEVETEDRILSPFAVALEQPPKRVSDSSEAEENIPENINPKAVPSPEVITPDSKRQRKSSPHSTPTTKAVISERGYERPQRKRKLPYKLIDESVIKDSKETVVIINEHKKCKSSLKPMTPTTSTPIEPDPESEAERLKHEKLLDFQRRYIMSQRAKNVEPSDPDLLSTTITFSLMDIGISLNANGEVTLAMPDSIGKLAQAGGSVNINFDVSCLDDDNCLKFKVTEDKDAITTAIGIVVDKTPDVPMLIESESSDERSQSPKPEKEKIVPIMIEDEDPPLTTTNQTTVSTPSHDFSTQVNLNIQSEDDYLDEKLLRTSTANGFVSFPRFTHVTGSSLAAVHKVMKSVKKGLSIDKLTRKPTWFCALCNLSGDYGDMGPLFGPFDLYVPPKNSYRNKSMSDGAKNLFEKLSSTFNKDINMNDESEITIQREEVWLHEDCICWSPGVYMIGFNVYGLEEIFKVARFTVCSECGEIGASLGCFKEGCSSRYHYLCSIKSKCKLISTTFTVICPAHSHAIVDNCLSIKPFLQVRNFLSKEEINESEILLLGRRPGDDARETAVKITKTRIIRSRKSKAKKKTIEEVRRSVPVKEEEEEEEPNVQGDGDTTIEDTAIEYRCFGCGSSYEIMKSIRHHFTRNTHTACRKLHLARLVDYDDDLPPGVKVCYSCGHYVKEGRMKAHLVNTPSQRCMTEHMRVVKDVKGLNIESYFIEDKAFYNSTHDYKDNVIDSNSDTFKCYSCCRNCSTIRQHRRHLSVYQECRDRHIELVMADDSGVPDGFQVCFCCGYYVKKGPMRHHYSKRGQCKETHERRSRLKRMKEATGEPDGDGHNEGKMEEEEGADSIAFIANYQIECYGCRTFFANPSSHKKHLKRTRKCRDQHINRVRLDTSGIPDRVEVCLSCGNYVMKGKLINHFAKTKVLRKDCEETHMKILNARKDEEESLLAGEDKVEEPLADKPTEITVVKGKEVKSKVKVEKLDAAEAATLQSDESTPKPKQDAILHCSKCETRTKDRAYLKKHFRAQHCPVGCGDYDLICTVCVRALKKIVTFPRGLEGFDYTTISKTGLKCPECPATSQISNTHYIRSHYREQHCKLGCSKYDQICTGCVTVLEKLTTWPKPLVGHDYSTGPPPVGFQCPKCRKGIDRQYFKRHYRHLHCKSHCIEQDNSCKKCAVLFKKMNLLPK